MSAPGTAAPERPVHAPPPRPAGGGPFGRGPMGGMGMPAEKAMTFKPSAKRLLRRLAPQRAKVAAVLVLAVRQRRASPSPARSCSAGRPTSSSPASSAGSCPAGITRSRRPTRPGPRATATSPTCCWGPASSRGRASTSARWPPCCSGRVALYVAASVFSWLQGYLLNDVVQATVLRLRSDVEDKLHRLPLRYFDRMPRGELLSRVTNDIDNVSQTLQQTMSQLLTSLLTVSRRAGRDGPDLAAARGDRAGQHPAVGGRDHPDREAVAEAVRGAVGQHRQAERAHRGGVHRARARHRVRPPARGAASSSWRRTRRCSRPASGRSSSPA